MDEAEDSPSERTLPTIAEESARGLTLLPQPIASAVSFAARSSSLSLRVGAFFGNAAVHGARVTTLTGLELGRGALEGILSRAGRNVSENSISDQGKEAVASYLDQTLTSLHSTITYAAFWASSGFQLTSSAITSANILSQHFLASLDQIFGDTESSRAIAAIVTLTRREFGSPIAGLPGEKLGLTDLLVGTVAFALLQKWCLARTEQELEEQGTTQAVWDVVVLDNGRRADVITARPRSAVSARENRMRAARSTASRPTSFISASNGEEILEAVPREKIVSNDASAFSQSLTSPDDSGTIATFNQLLIDQLPPTAQVSIKSVITKLVTVEISGSQPPNIQAPSGYSIVKRESQDTQGLPFHRIVFEANEQSVRTTGFEETTKAELFTRAIPPTTSPISTKEACGDGSSHRVFPVNDDDAVDSGYDTEKAPVEPPVMAVDPSQVEYSRLPSSSRQCSQLDASSSPDRNAFQANQKRQRKSPKSRLPVSTGPWSPPPADARHAQKKVSSGDLRQKADTAEKKKSLRQAIKQGASNSGLKNFWTRDLSKPAIRRSPCSSPSKPDVEYQDFEQNFGSASNASRNPEQTHTRHSSLEAEKSSSRTNFYSVNQREESFTSKTYSTQHIDSLEPGSSNRFSLELDSQTGSEVKDNEGSHIHTRTISGQAHSRSNSIISGTFTITNNISTGNLSLHNPISIAQDHDISPSLHRSGYLPGQYPRDKFVHNIWRYSRYAIASYGSTFLRLVGAISPKNASSWDEKNIHHKEHHFFSDYTDLEPSGILLSSFVDPQGGTDASGQTETGVPLVHYVSLDHVSKTVVLTCRGTLEFDDLLTDMTCDYDQLMWQGSMYSVHKGILASARRLLEGKGGRVVAVIKAALEEFKDYGLVLCGHSLGGAVTAVLAMLLSEPNTSNILDPNSSAFITTKQHPMHQPLQLPSPNSTSSTSTFPSPNSSTLLPPGRAIHVYAYGPPATVSPTLAKACRGLITTICHNADLIPYLSLGTLRDIQAISLAFKTDSGGAKAEIKQRVWDGLANALHGRFGGENFWDNGNGLHADPADEDTWPWAALKSLRANMIYEKLVPPGEVFVVETSRVLQRDALPSAPPSTAELDFGDSTRGSASVLGRPATRVQMKRVGEPEKWFGELRLRGSMFADHTPNRYENALTILKKGVGI